MLISSFFLQKRNCCLNSYFIDLVHLVSFSAFITLKDYKEKPAFSCSGLCVLQKEQLGKLHLVCALWFVCSQIDCSFSLVARIFIEKLKVKDCLSFLVCILGISNTSSRWTFERKIDKQDQLKNYLNLPNKELEP